MIIEKDNILFEFSNINIKKNWFKKKSVKGYLLYTNLANEVEIYEITEIKHQIQKLKGEKKYYFLDYAIFLYKNKPMFWIYKDNLITVNSLKTQNEEYIALFSPENWYNIIEKVITSKLTRGENGLMSEFWKKYWKIILVIIIAGIGFAIQQGYIGIK